MSKLRDPHNGCPWDLEQTFETIAPYTLEEAYEVREAITNNDYDSLKDELGDLLLQIVFHSQIADESDIFNFDNVVNGICNKMVERHPHVFGNAKIDTADAVDFGLLAIIATALLYPYNAKFGLISKKLPVKYTGFPNHYVPEVLMTVCESSN